ncbi:MAG: nucleotidyltransferase domain-containing protein [Saprospirales bacterium]|jgi:predicted nucleotidyltransferase|nr:nucleotidyltransferase domain-containing protein [Saprospirales bacterium]
MKSNTIHNLDKKQILAILTQHREALKDMGVERIALFGSYARGTARPDSDVDLLVELKEPKYLLLLQLTDYLSELLGHKVDLIRQGPHLKRRFMEAVEKDLAYV